MVVEENAGSYRVDGTSPSGLGFGEFLVKPTGLGNISVKVPVNFPTGAPDESKVYHFGVK